MFVVANRVSVAEGWEGRFEERFRNRAGQVEKQPGFLRMDILRPLQTDAPYVVLTVWEDQRAFEGWLGSDDFKAAHKSPLPREAFAAEGKLERHESVISVVRE